MKPFLHLPDKIERYTKLHAEHGQAFYDLRLIVGQAPRDGRFTKSMQEAHDDTLVKFKDLSQYDDPRRNKRLASKCFDAVNREIPVTDLWTPW